MMFKCINGLTPDYLSNCVTDEVCHDYNTRHSQKTIVAQNCRTEAFRKSFMLAGAKYWNKLPTDLKNSSSLAIFKRKLRNFDIMFQYYLIFTT